MYDDCSPAVQRTIAAAEIWRERCDVAHISGNVLILAMTDDEDGRAWALLAGHGLPIAAFRERWREFPPPSGSLAEVLRHGHELARRHGEDATLTTDYFLLGILRTEPRLCAYLKSLGLRLADLESAIIGAEAPPLELTEPILLADPGEQFTTGRILDAAFNRAREGLRVVEDYCRFGLDDPHLTREFKTLRHELGELAGHFPPALLIGARETQTDVGAGISTASEGQRHSPMQIAFVNLKRAQEALRTVEEFSKLAGPGFGSAIERLRYRVYTLEKAMVGEQNARTRLEATRLCVILGAEGCDASLDWTIGEAAAGGADMFQLREKNLPDRELLARAREVRRLTRAVRALFIVNDRPDIARLAEADGVHLGQDDMPVKEARRIIGSDALIGVSTHTIDDVRRAVLDGASYIGVGPTFASTTKQFQQLAGLAFVQIVTRESSIPAFVLGGITTHNVIDAVRAGAKRIAVSAAVCRSPEPKLAALALRQTLDSSMGSS